MKIFSKEQASRIIEEHTPGAKVIEIHRQSRWRPTWFADIEINGQRDKIVLRGDRPDSRMYALDHEYKFHKIMYEQGFKVPAVYDYVVTPGYIDTFLTSFVPGVPHFNDPISDHDRDTVVDEYLQEMARLHMSDPTPYLDAGIQHPEPGVNASSAKIVNQNKAWRAAKNYPDPFMEFGIGWRLRHLPDTKGRAVPVISDTGQFHHMNGHMTAVLDLEFGHIDDPMTDLATWRMRDTLIPFGDFAKIYARYEELTGTEVDLETIKRYHFSGCLGNQIMFGYAVHHPTLDTDLMTFMQWDSETNLMATDFLGEYLGIELPEVEIPKSRVTRDDESFNYLVGLLGSVRIADEEPSHQMRLAFRTARMLQRRHQIGNELDEADIDDVHELLGGKRPESWLDAEHALEKFVIADAETGKYDEQLTILFHKRNSRYHMALGPQGSTMTRHYQCQRFDGAPNRIVQF